MDIYIGYGISVTRQSMLLALVKNNIIEKDTARNHTITKDDLERLLDKWDKKYHNRTIERKDTFTKSVANGFSWIRHICKNVEYYGDRFDSDIFKYIRVIKDGYYNRSFIQYNDEVKEILALTEKDIWADKYDYKGNPKQDIDNTNWISLGRYCDRHLALYKNPTVKDYDELAYTNEYTKSFKLYKLGEYLMSLAKKYFKDNENIDILDEMGDYESLRLSSKTKTEDPKDLPFTLSIVHNEKEDVYFLVQSSSKYHQICINIEGYTNNLKATLERKVWKEFDLTPGVCMFLGNYEIKLKK